MNGISEANPFVGPRPIQPGEALYGRKTEIRELHEQLQARRIVVLHSPSGAGKSSLVQAGLIPRLQAGKFFDVWKPIRVNLDPVSFEGLPEGTNRYLLSAMVSLEDELPAERRRSPAELARLDFLEYLDSRPRRKKRADHSVVLLFDQFEEVLSVAPRAVAAKEAFFASVGRALDTGKYWALFIIREDYLAALAPYRDLIPTQMSNTFRLDLLGLEGAREAALNLAKEGGRSFPAVDKLVRDLSAVQVQRPDGTFATEQGLHVEPVHLQVVCRRLWEAMPDDDLSIDEEDIEAYAGVSTSLAGYYADAVRGIAGDDAALERSVREWIGTKLIVGGIRSQVRQEAGSSAGLDNRTIEELLDSYLVRTEQRAGANWFELSHDRLVEPILEDNDAWRRAHLHPLQVQAQLWENGGHSRALLLTADALPDALVWAAEHPTLLTELEEEFLEHSRTLQAEEASARRRQRIFTLTLAAIALVALVLGAVAWQLRGQAERGRRQALAAKIEAERAQHEAMGAKEEAERARGRAEGARQEAVGARIEAEHAHKKYQRLTRDLLRQMFQVALRRFIDKLAADGVVSGEIEVDERWTPLLERKGQIFAAATVLESGGRIIAAGHHAVLSEVDEHGDSLFVEITGEWLLGDQARRGIAIVTQRPGSYDRLEILRRSLSALGYEHEVDPPLEALAESETVGLVIVDNRWWKPFSAEEIAAVEAFVRGGGGLLVVGGGRTWLDREPGEDEPAPTLDNYPMNQLMSPFGVRWAEATIDPGVLEEHEQDATVRFENRAAFAVNVLSRSYEGREEYYTTMERDEVLDLRTSLGREWVIRAAADERAIGEVTIEASRQVVTIGETVTTKKSAPRPKVPPKPPTKEESDELPERLSNAAMKPAFTAAAKASKACGQTHGSLMPAAKVEFEVAPSGKVTSARALPPMKGTSVGTCVAKAVSDQRFPRSREGVTKTWTLPL